MTVSETTRTPTRERIVAAAQRLFAQQGYHGTTVGDIEAAAGLSPRRGALYKHFPSKEDVLRAAVAEHTASVDEMDARLQSFDLGDLRAEIVLIGRWGLAELRREHELTRIVMKEGDRFPEVAKAVRDAIVRRGHRIAAGWVERYAAQAGGRVADPEAVASFFLDALVGYTLQELLFGPAPAGVDEERFLAAWVEGTLAVMRSLVGERSPSHV